MQALDTPLYAKGRRLFIVDGAFAWISTNLVSGAYLSGYLDTIGFPVALNGVLHAFPALCGLAQIAGPYLAEYTGSNKRFVIVVTALCRYGFAIMYMSGLLFRTSWAMAVAALLLFISNTLQAMVTPTTNAWLLGICPPSIRGKYTGMRDSVGLVTAAVATLVMGRALDAFKAAGSPLVGFAAIGLFLALCATISTLLLSKIEDITPAKQKKHITILARLRLPFQYKAFHPVLVLGALYQVAMQIGVAYWNLYLIRDLGVGYGLISFLTFVCMLERSVMAQIWGKLADRTSWRAVTTCALTLVCVTHFCCFMLTEDNLGWLYPLAMLLNGLGFSAISICMMNVQYQYAPKEDPQMFIGVNNALNGVLGFAAVLMGGVMINAMGANGILLGGSPFAPPPFLMGLSSALMLVCAMYTWFVLKQKNEAT